jgi:spore maturation protein CgeB
MSNVRVLLLNPAPALIKYGIKWGFEKAGCFVYLLEGEERIFDKSQEEQLKKIAAAIKKYDINYIFCEGYSNMPIHEISKLCRDNKIRFDFWTIEDPVTPHIGEHKAREKLVDFIWTTTQEYIPKYKALGVDSDLLLFGCNPDFHKPVVSEDRFKHDMSIIGTNYSNRFNKTEEFIIPLIENDFDIKIYGQWWYLQSQEVNLLNYRYKKVVWEEPGYAGLPYEWLPIVVNSSKIMIGLNCSDESITQTSCRPYETLASSGESVYLAYYTEAQEKLFGKYIYQAKTTNEMIEMAEMILAMSSVKRRALALIARDYVVKTHNYKIRAEKILSTF